MSHNQDDNKKTGESPVSDKEEKKTTDPQENMQGPISSLVQGIKEKVEEDDSETKAEADKKKEENL